jgi:hypothetical protein
MDVSPGAPLLLETIERLLARERQGRRNAALRRALLATTLAIVIVALWRVADRVSAREPMPVAYAAFLVAAVLVWGLVVTLRRAAGGDRVSMARELDRRLGLADRASSALAVVGGGTTTRLAPYVLRDAETAIEAAAPRIDAHFPAATRGRRILTVRRQAVIAALAVLVALLAELLTIGGPFRWLPGASPDATKDPTEDPGSHEPQAGGGPDARKESPPRPAPEPRPEDEPKPAQDAGDVRVTLRMAKQEYGPDEPVAATVGAAAAGPLQGAREFDVRVSVDDDEIDAGVRIDVDAARKGGASVDLDLSKIPGLRLPPGEHTARARLTTRTDREEHVSPPVKFRIREREDGGGQGGDEPPPKPKPKPEPQAPQQDEQQKPDEKEGQPSAPPPPPPVVLDRKFVVPLFGEGDLVKKKGPVLVLDPGGGTEAPPERRPIGDALPEAKKRAEAAVDQARLSDADRELVRRYFELLEALRR